MELFVECDFGKGTLAYKEGKKFYVEWDDYFKHVEGHSFRLNTRGYVMYYSRKDGLYNKYLHRVIMGEPEGWYIDHINHDKLNNCRSNLRIVTNQQNMMNHSKYKNNTSGFIGVCWRKDKEKWHAQIKVNYKTIHLGLFDVFDDACQARKEAEIKYFGEFRNKDNE